MPRLARASSRTAACLALALAPALALPAAAAPPVPPLPSSIEALASYDPQSTCSPTVKTGTGALRSLVLAAYSGTGDSGIVRDCAIGGTSEHKEGRAWDWRVNAYDPAQDAAAKELLAWLLATDQYGNTNALARRLGVMYMIYNRHIWSAYNASAGWRPYTGANPHTDHVHISLSWPGANKTTSYWTGRVATTSTGTTTPTTTDTIVTPAIMAEYNDLGGEEGPLGAPLGREYAVPGGRAHDFSGGRVYWTASGGARAVYGAIATKFLALGGHTGPLGLPISDEGDVEGNPGARGTRFVGGAVYWSPRTGPQSVYGAIAARHAALGGPAGFLGLPTADEVGVTGGRMSAFTGGRIYYSGATGAQPVRGAVLVKYLALGGPASPLGFPAADEADVPGVPGARASRFTGGSVIWSPATGPQSVFGAIALRYAELGGPTGFLGLPTADEVAVPGGRMTAFAGGRVYYSGATGAQPVRGAVLVKYLALGGPASSLGFPAADEADVPGVRGARASRFAGGYVYWSPATGPQSVYGAIAARYAELGGPSGSLGLPTADEAAVAGGRVSVFSGGRVYWSGATGAHPVRGAILLRYLASGGPATHGFPLADEVEAGTTGRVSAFERAKVYWAPGTGEHAVTGLFLGHHDLHGGASGVLGLPVAAVEPATSTSQQQRFAAGRVYAWGGRAQHVRGAILLGYLSQGGPAGRYGLPVSDEYDVPGGRRTDFQNGAITYTYADGRLSYG